MKKYLIKDIFGPTIQGEGSFAGTVVKFVRFSSCNRWTGRERDRDKAVCWFCDTDFLGGRMMTASDVVVELAKIGPPKVVVLSGGEATLQLDHEILSELRLAGYQVHLETNGSNDISGLAHLIDHVVMSPKQTPENTKLARCDDLKVLYPPPIPGVSPEAFSAFNARSRFIQPVDGPDAKKNVDLSVSYCLEHPDWKLSLQNHKLLGVP